MKKTIILIMALMLIGIVIAGSELARKKPIIEDNKLDRLELCGYTTTYKINSNPIVINNNSYIVITFSNHRHHYIKLETEEKTFKETVEKYEEEGLRKLAETCKIKITDERLIDDSEIELR